MSDTSLPVLPLWRQTLILFSFDRWAWVRRQRYLFLVSLVFSLINHYVLQPQFSAIQAVAKKGDVSALHFSDFSFLLLMGLFEYIFSVASIYFFLIDFLTTGGSQYEPKLSFGRFFSALGYRFLSWTIIILPAAFAGGYIINLDNSIFSQFIVSTEHGNKNFDLTQIAILIFGVAASFYIWLRFILVWPCAICGYKPVVRSSWRLTGGRFKPILSHGMRLFSVAIVGYFLFAIFLIFLFSLVDQSAADRNPINPILSDWFKLVLTALYAAFLATIFIACTGQKTS